MSFEVTYDAAWKKKAAKIKKVNRSIFALGAALSSMPIRESVPEYFNIIARQKGLQDAFDAGTHGGIAYAATKAYGIHSEKIAEVYEQYDADMNTAAKVAQAKQELIEESNEALNQTEEERDLLKAQNRAKGKESGRKKYAWKIKKPDNSTKLFSKQKDAVIDLIADLPEISQSIGTQRIKEATKTPGWHVLSRTNDENWLIKRRYTDNDKTDYLQRKMSKPYADPTKGKTFESTSKKIK